MTAPGGFLAELELEKVEDDPNAFPNGTYNAYLTDVNVRTLANGEHKGEKRLVLTYKLSDGEHKGKTIDEWKNCDPKAPPRDKSWLKQRLKSLGVPEERFSSLNPADLVGIAVTVTTKQNGQYRNVTNLVLGHTGQETPQAAASAALDGTPAPTQPTTESGTVTDLI